MKTAPQKTEFAQWLQELIDEGKISKQQIAERCGVSLKTVYEWLDGKGPNAERAIRQVIMNVIGMKNRDSIKTSEETLYLRRSLFRETMDLLTRAMKAMDELSRLL